MKQEAEAQRLLRLDREAGIAYRGRIRAGHAAARNYRLDMDDAGAYEAERARLQSLADQHLADNRRQQGGA